ncbi:hypothetical protein LY78DRAFT_20080 [Colletotrichum sublineola]|nr:hypothetical protein LY78DRAFT_20080 [Colletotrichum sublineola]
MALVSLLLHVRGSSTQVVGCVRCAFLARLSPSLLCSRTGLVPHFFFFNSFLPPSFDLSGALLRAWRERGDAGAPQGNLETPQTRGGFGYEVRE